jgi:hypothetical protein
MRAMSHDGRRTTAERVDRINQVTRLSAHDWIWRR